MQKEAAGAAVLVLTQNPSPPALPLLPPELLASRMPLSESPLLAPLPDDEPLAPDEESLPDDEPLAPDEEPLPDDEPLADEAPLLEPELPPSPGALPLPPLEHAPMNAVARHTDSDTPAMTDSPWIFMSPLCHGGAST